MVGRCACSPLLREFPRFPLGETAQLPNNLSIIHGVGLIPKTDYYFNAIYDFFLDKRFYF